MTRRAALPTGFEHHPGFPVDICQLQITVQPGPYSTSSKGFACGYTGGHCLPGEQCDRWRQLQQETRI